MRDKIAATATIGAQIRFLRQAQHWTLAELARRAGTSGPAIHRYENGWDRFELETLRRIAAALHARLEIRLVAATATPRRLRHLSPGTLIKQIAPLFWDHDLEKSDLAQHRDWVLERVLTVGDRSQARAARAYFGDDAIRSAVQRRGVDARTRTYWKLILGDSERASESP